MKKLLLLISSVALSFSPMMAQSDSDPVFPETFGVTTSCDLNVEQGEDYGTYTIIISGECPDDKYTVTLAVPEGWDGFVCLSLNDADPNIEPLKRLGSYTPYETEWAGIDEFCQYYEYMMGIPAKMTNSITFSIDDEDPTASFYLYKDGMIDSSNGIWVEGQVVKGEATNDPVFPETFGVTTSCDLNVEQGEDWGVYTIVVSGECPDDSYTVTLAVPEGWDGFVCLSLNDADPNIEPLKRLGSYTPYETEWAGIDEFCQYYEYMMGIPAKKTNSVTFAIDDEDPTASFYLYKDGMVDASNGIWVESYVVKKAAGPVFPDVIDVTANSETVTVTQEYDEEVEAIAITVTGTTTEDDVTLSFNLPEGWDGIIGGIMSFGYMSSRAESDWFPIDGFRELMEMYGMQLVQGTELTFPADGNAYMGSYYPYAGDMVDTGNGFAVVVMVEKDELSGIEAVEVDNTNARYFNLQGAEVESPKAGIYVKVANGKASKVLVK